MRVEHAALLCLAHVAQHDNPDARAVATPRLLASSLEELAQALRHGRIPAGGGDPVHPAAPAPRAAMWALLALARIPSQHVGAGRGKVTRQVLPSHASRFARSRSA